MQQFSKSVYGLFEKTLKLRSLLKAGFPVPGQINHYTAIVIAKLPGYREPVTARSKKPVKKNNAGQ
jgi:hypothetical protein